MRPSIAFLAVVIALILGHFSTRFIAPSNPAGEIAGHQAKQRLISTHFTLDIRRIDAPFLENSNGGTLARLGDRLLLMTGAGEFHMLRTDRSGFDPLEIPPPFDRAEAQALFIRPKDKNATGAERLLARRSGDGWELFVSHTRAHPEKSCITLAVSRLGIRAEGNNLTVSQPWRLIFETAPCLSAPEAFPFQSGGMLAFAADGRLVLASGDHGYDDFNRTDPRIKTGELNNDYGKVIAIDPDTGTGTILASGLRNSSGLTVDDRGRIWEVEHGPMGGDELNLIEPGANYGWPSVTYGVHYGTHRWPLSRTQGRHPGFRKPVYAWVPSIAVSSLIQVKGGTFPAWRGDLLAGALKGRKLVRLRIGEGPRVIVAEPMEIGVRVRALAQLSSGEIAVMADEQPTVLILRPIASGETPDELPAAVTTCAECHSFAPEGAGGSAPTLWAVWQRDIASLPGTDYSTGLKAIPGRWDRATLAAYLAAPGNFAPGTAMPSPGLGPDDIDAVLNALEDLN
jgi:cytochrome c2